MFFRLAENCELRLCMSDSTIRRYLFRSADELLSHAPAWDDLWSRSPGAAPTVQARQLALWLEHFAKDQPLRILVVEQQGHFVAALPLMGKRFKNLVTLGTLPDNDWTNCGDLLLDPNCDTTLALDTLVGGFDQLDWPLLRLYPVVVDSPRMLALAAACRRASLGFDLRGSVQIGQVTLPESFTDYEKSLSGNHRRHMRKAEKRIDREGGAELHVYDQLAPDDVEPLMRTGFEVEDRSWKGRQGDSVLRTPGMFEFYLHQAQQFAAEGQLRLVMLTYQDKPIAFEYGWLARGLYYTPKVGYDESFSRFTPGQILRNRLYRQMCTEGDVKAIDFCGPLSSATEKWVTSSYSMGSAVVALRPLSGRLLLGAYRAAMKLRERRAARADAAN